MEPLVSIVCTTYNHVLFVRQCLNGITTQKTNFLFEVIIHDDASDDGTVEIIKEYEKKYPEIIKPIYQRENQYSKKVDIYETYIYPRAKGKYIAICEGDDYWIDENKLQMQVDFLENNPEYGMCYTKAKPYNQSMQKFNKKSIGADFDGFEDLLKNGNRIPTLSTVYRKDLLDKYQKEIQPSNKGWLMGDYPMWLYFSHESKIQFMDEVTAVYRVLENSASHSVDVEKSIRFNSNIEVIRKFFSEYFSISVDIKNENEIAFYVYVNVLIKQYTKETAKKLRQIYKKNSKKSIKLFCYSLLSYSGILWNLIMNKEH